MRGSVERPIRYDVIEWNLLTVIIWLEDGSDERLGGASHQLQHDVIQRILVLVQPAGDVVAHLRQRCIRNIGR